MLCHVRGITYLYGENKIKNKMKSYMPKIQKLSANTCTAYEVRVSLHLLEFLM